MAECRESSGITTAMPGSLLQYAVCSAMVLPICTGGAQAAGASARRLLERAGRRRPAGGRAQPRRVRRAAGGASAAAHLHPQQASYCPKCISFSMMTLWEDG